MFYFRKRVFVLYKNTEASCSAFSMLYVAHRFAHVTTVLLLHNFDVFVKIKNKILDIFLSRHGH
jgi:hypothetical protein